MAEFCEVVKQYKRMCETKKCSNCPVDKLMCENRCTTCWWVAYVVPSEFENCVMSWAEQHPEPQYPTWIKWLEDNGYIRAKYYDPIDFTEKAREPIPADIAEKLGLQLEEKAEEKPRTSDYSWE